MVWETNSNIQHTICHRLFCRVASLACLRGSLSIKSYRIKFFEPLRHGKSFSRNFLEILKIIEKLKHFKPQWIKWNNLLTVCITFDFKILTWPISYIFLLLNRFHKKLTRKNTFLHKLTKTTTTPLEIENLQFFNLFLSLLHPLDGPKTFLSNCDKCLSML